MLYYAGIHTAEIFARGRTDRLALPLRTLLLLALADVVPHNWVGSVRAGGRRSIWARGVPKSIFFLDYEINVFFGCFPTCSPQWGCSQPCPRWCSRGGWGRRTGASCSSPLPSGRQLLRIENALQQSGRRKQDYESQKQITRCLQFIIFKWCDLAFSNLQMKFEKCERQDEAVTFKQLYPSLRWSTTRESCVACFLSIFVWQSNFDFLFACHLDCWSLPRTEVTFLPATTTYMSGEHLCLDNISVKLKLGAKLLVEEAAVLVANQE